MDSNIFVAIIGAVGGSGVASIVIALLNRYWTKKDKKEDKLCAITEAQKVIMIDRVRYLGKCFISDGEIRFDDKETLTEMYKAYKSLGGNGHLEAIMKEIEKLKVI